MTIAILAALSGAILSLQAWHEKQRLLFFAELLLQSQRWHCHKAARAEADIIVLGILLRIGWGGSDRAKARKRCPRRKVWEESKVLFRSVELPYVALGTDQISTLYIKRWESQRESQLSKLPPQCPRPSFSMTLQTRILRAYATNALDHFKYTYWSD